MRVEVSRREIGIYLSSQLPKYHTLAEVAAILLIDKKYVRRIEIEALWKIYIRMIELKNESEINGSAEVLY